MGRAGGFLVVTLVTLAILVLGLAVGILVAGVSACLASRAAVVFLPPPALARVFAPTLVRALACALGRVCLGGFGVDVFAMPHTAPTISDALVPPKPNELDKA